jgi:hypothetical protein
MQPSTPPTFGDVTRQTAHRSLWRDSLEKRAGGRPLDEWLVEQANLRGIYGAFGPESPQSALDPSFGLEDIVVALLQPHNVADLRLFKLILRILQSGRLEPQTLAIRCRRERADHVLWWFLGQIPPTEVNEAVAAIRNHLTQPRGYHPPALRYEPKRLEKRPFRPEGAPWTRRPESS